MLELISASRLPLAQVHGHEFWKSNFAGIAINQPDFSQLTLHINFML